MIASKTKAISVAILVTLVTISFPLIPIRHALAFAPQYFIPVRPVRCRYSFSASESAIPLYMASTVSNMTVATNTNDDNDREDIQLKGSQLKPKMLDHEEGPVTAIHSIAEFLSAVENTRTNELVIVKFHAKFCRVCSRVILKYKKMAHRLASTDTPVPIKFISVETTANPKIIEKLGVKKFPFLQIYRNGECVASFGTGPAHNFQSIVGDTIEQKLKMSVEDWEAFRKEFQSEIANSIDNLEFLRLESEIGNSCSIPLTDKKVSP